MEKGTILNIQRYSVHDGPGIRTTVFLKGCPLNCWWCHNPESQSRDPEVLYLESRCIRCGSCVAACPQHAVVRTDCGYKTDRTRCTSCGACAKACLPGAREVAGKAMTDKEVMGEILKDRAFFDESGGGVTFSGGEPLMQPSFLLSLLRGCRDEGLKVALDTTGFALWPLLENVLPLVDVFLYDVKVIDDEKHRKYTGVSNDIILNNLSRLAARHKGVRARIPLVPGVNDDERNLRETGSLLAELGIRQASVLPYHTLGIEKYKRLGQEYKLTGVEPPQAECIERARATLAGYGLDVKVGG